MDLPPLPPDEPDFDSLETRMSSQPLRMPPPAWRSEILARARAASGSTKSEPAAVSESWFLAGLLRGLREFPIAWSALAAVWLCILALNAVDRWSSGGPAPSPRISEVQWAELKRQRMELGELAGLRVQPSPGPALPERNPDPPAVLRPRSSRRVLQGPMWARLGEPFRPEFTASAA